jgi:hypothetical protein
MAIQNEMYKQIEREIDQIASGSDKPRIIVDYDKAKKVARALTDLSTSKSESDSLVSQYIANIKNICNS